MIEKICWTKLFTQFENIEFVFCFFFQISFEDRYLEIKMKKKNVREEK